MSIEDILEVLAVELLGVVPEDDYIVVSTNKGEPAVLHGNSKAGQSYRDIAARIMGEDVPIQLPSDAEGILARLRRMFGSR